MSRLLFSKWWPDQVAGAVLLLSAALLAWAGPQHFDGTGVGARYGDATTYAWLAWIVASSAAIVVTTELDLPAWTGGPLISLSIALATNAVLTGGAKGPGAGMAAGVYTVASIYLGERARLSFQLAKARKRPR